MANDHFSLQSREYVRYRPVYPSALFRWLARQAPRLGCAWDSATGNGQAALGLAQVFPYVIATDISPQQLSMARHQPAIHYLVAPSEKTPIEDNSIDLVLVAQALHWFDLPRFYEEVRRVCKSGAVMAAICYGLLRIDPEIDRQVDQLYGEVLAADWPPERQHVENAYASLPFPFPAIRAPNFQMRERWSLDHLLGYLATWSAKVRYQTRTGVDPLEEAAPRIRNAWGPAERSRRVEWRLQIKAGRVD
ncbi:MAG: class I SAM-dependent methyltransferase [Gammaproteobacteria bacterium]